MIKISRNVAIAISSAAIAVSAPLGAQHSPASSNREARTVEVVLADGTPAGTVEFEEMRQGLVVRARLKNLTVGGHGVHLHQTGSCSPDFKAAGSHLDPVDAKHGFDGSGDYHVGDLSNIFAGTDGVAQADFFVPQVTLQARANKRYPFTLDDRDGTAIMIHADEDNYIDMDSAGGREACGVIFAAKNESR